MRPVQQGFVVLATIVIAGLVGLGIARLLIGPAIEGARSRTAAALDASPVNASRPSPAATAVLGIVDDTPPAVSATAVAASPTATVAEPTATAVEAGPTATPEPTLEALATPQSGTVQVRTFANLRAEPGPDGRVIQVLDSSAVLELLGATEQTADGAVWLNVRYQAREGWVNQRLVR